MEIGRPVILVGVENHSLASYAEEVLLGIEEEGCMGETYIYEGDIIFSAADVSILVKNDSIALYIKEAGRTHRVYGEQAYSPLDMRKMGKNGGRYLKHQRMVY